jgi:hypothetical protein
MPAWPELTYTTMPTHNDIHQGQRLEAAIAALPLSVVEGPVVDYPDKVHVKMTTHLSALNSRVFDLFSVIVCVSVFLCVGGFCMFLSFAYLAFVGACSLFVLVAFAGQVRAYAGTGVRGQGPGP